MKRVRHLLCAAALVLGATQAAAAAEMVFVSWGGAYQDAIRNAWIKPFAEKTGIEVLEENDPETAKLKAMIDTGTVTWDVVTDGGVGFVRGIQQGLFEKLDPAVVDVSHVYPEAKSEYGVPSEVFSTNFAFSTQAFPDGGPQPASWADFWDVEKFPGKRAVYASPNGVIEAALMADGVPPGEVYQVLATKEGQDRAFAMIEKLKPHVAVWWTSGAQPVQALGSGEVVMANGWNGRFQNGIKEGLPIRQVWNGALAEVGYFMVVKGAPHREAAMDFLKWVISPEAQARFHEFISYGPTTPKAWDLIPQERWADLPSSPENLAKSVWVSVPWWAENDAKIAERYQATVQ